MEVLLGIIGVIIGICLLVKFWYIVLPIIAIIAILCIVYYVYTEKQQRKREQEEAKRQLALEQQRLAARKRKIDQTGFFTFEYRGKNSAGVVETFALLNEITKYPFIIDTNIWMEYSNLKCFWDQLAYCCAKNHCQVVIPSEVYDEIIHLTKNGKNSNTKYAARTAKNLLFELDNKHLLSIYNLQVNRNNASYADPVLIQVCKAIIKNGQSCYLLTNDKDLTIRARHLVNQGSEQCKVLGVHTTEFSYAENEFYIPTI